MENIETSDEQEVTCWQCGSAETAEICDERQCINVCAECGAD